MTALPQQYQAALGAWLHRKGPIGAATSIGRAAASKKISSLQVARWHERAANAEAAMDGNGSSVATMKKAGRFFMEAIKPIERAQREAAKESERCDAMKETLARNSEQMVSADKKLKLELLRRAKVEQRLAESEKTHHGLLKKSAELHDDLRLLSRRIISAHESERRQISRDLHDQIASALAGINGELNNLKNDVAGKNIVLKRKVAKVQRLVQESVEGVHQFARMLRPPVLDDLGLGPALQTLVKTVSTHCAVTLRLNVHGSLGSLDTAKKTALYRVAQEALNNILKHAKAKNAKIDLRRCGHAVELTIHDDGKAFAPGRHPRGDTHRRLGVLGMRERIAMVGGSFDLNSERGKGTTVFARVPSRLKAYAK